MESPGKVVAATILVGVKTLVSYAIVGYVAKQALLTVGKVAQ